MWIQDPPKRPIHTDTSPWYLVTTTPIPVCSLCNVFFTPQFPHFVWVIVKYGNLAKKKKKNCHNRDLRSVGQFAAFDSLRPKATPREAGPQWMRCTPTKRVHAEDPPPRPRPPLRAWGRGGARPRRPGQGINGTSYASRQPVSRRRQGRQEGRRWRRRRPCRVSAALLLRRGRRRRRRQSQGSGGGSRAAAASVSPALGPPPRPAGSIPRRPSAPSNNRALVRAAARAIEGLSSARAFAWGNLQCLPRPSAVLPPVSSTPCPPTVSSGAPRSKLLFHFSVSPGRTEQSESPVTRPLVFLLPGLTTIIHQNYLVRHLSPFSH